MATSGPRRGQTLSLASPLPRSTPSTIVAITGQVSSKVLGSDAFQEVDITGITLPITKHNYLVTRAEDIAPAVREAFLIARSGLAPAPSSSTSPRTRKQATATFDFEAAAPPPHRDQPHAQGRIRLNAASHRAHQSPPKSPVIPRRPTAIVESGARDQVIAFAERINSPVASTLLGLGAFPTWHPPLARHDGHARRVLGQPRHPAG